MEKITSEKKPQKLQKWTTPFSKKRAEKRSATYRRMAGGEACHPCPTPPFSSGL